MTWPPGEKALWAATLAAFAALLVFAGMRRLEVMDAVVTGQVETVTPQLSGDAASYARLASGTPFPCFSTEREPGILLVGRIALVLAGDPESAVLANAHDEAGRHRVLDNFLILRRWSLALSLLAMTALFGTALLVAGRCGALVAALLWADNLWLSVYGVGFLREDLAATFVLGSVAALIGLWRVPAERTRLRFALAAAAALCGAGLALTRLEGLGSTTLLVLAWIAARAASKRLTRRDALLAASIVAATWLLASPYLIFNSSKTGSALHPMQAHARFWRNHEFAGRPGFPTRAEVIRNSYCGEPTTPFHYVFGLHSLPAVAGRYLAGLWTGFTRYLPRLLADRNWLVWIVPFAVLALGWRRRWEGAFAVAAGIVALLPFAFILTLDAVLTPEPLATGVEPRFALPTLPFAFLWLAGGVGAAVEWLKRRRAAACPGPEGQ